MIHARFDLNMEISRRLMPFSTDTVAYVAAGSQHTCDGFLLTKTLGAQKNFAESRSISAIDVTPNTIFGCGKYKHCKTLRDIKHGPHLLLKSMKKFWKLKKKKTSPKN